MTVYHLCPCDRHSETGLPVLVALIGTRFRHSLLLLWAVFLVSIASSYCGLLLHNIRNNIVRFTFLTAHQCRRVIYRSGEISVPKRHRTHRVALWIHHADNSNNLANLKMLIFLAFSWQRSVKFCADVICLKMPC